MRKQKEILATITAGGNEGGLPEMVISSPTLDRENDRIIPSGGRFENFRKNPVLLWGHQHGQLPIGSVTRLNVKDQSIKAQWKWLENDIFAERVKHCWDEGICRAASIGFMPVRAMKNEGGGFDFLEWQLLELSLVTIPANPDAVRLLPMKSDKAADESSEIFDVDPDELRLIISEVVGNEIMMLTGRIPDKTEGRMR